MTKPLIEVGERVPALSLAAATRDGQVRLAGDGRSGLALVVVHGPACAACSEYVSGLAAAATELAAWECRLVVVVTDGGIESTEPPWSQLEAGALASDPGQSLRLAGLPVPGVVMADPWREVATVVSAGPDHAFPALAELIDWARYLAMKCPECEGEAR